MEFQSTFFQTHPPTPHPNPHSPKEKKKKNQTLVLGICTLIKIHRNSSELYKITYN